MASEGPVLVTGSSGYLGSEVVRLLRAAGRSVATPSRKEVDILNPASVRSGIRDAAAVIHAAGLAHVRSGGREHRERLLAVNGQGTANVARAAARAGVGHLVLVSSVSVYGPSPSSPVSETSLCKPLEPYGRSKLEAEQAAQEAVEGTDTRLTILRFTTIIGEQDPGNVARLVDTIARRRFVWIGSGANRKSLIYREDAARACLLALDRPDEAVRIYNVSAKPSTMREIVRHIGTHLKVEVPNWAIPAALARTGSGLGSVLSMGRGPLARVHRTLQKWLSDEVFTTNSIENDLGFSAAVSVSEGLRREVAWYRG